MREDRQAQRGRGGLRWLCLRPASASAAARESLLARLQQRLSLLSNQLQQRRREARARRAREGRSAGALLRTSTPQRTAAAHGKASRGSAPGRFQTATPATRAAPASPSARPPPPVGQPFYTPTALRPRFSAQTAPAWMHSNDKHYCYSTNTNSKFNCNKHLVLWRNRNSYCNRKRRNWSIYWNRQLYGKCRNTFFHCHRCKRMYSFNKYHCNSTSS